MRYVILMLALAGSLAARAQAVPGTISGLLPGCADSTTVTVAEPAAGTRLNYFFSAWPNEALVRGQRFSYRLHGAPTSLLLLRGKCVPQLWVFTEPGAQVTFSQHAAAGGGGPTYTFGGLNAAANDLLANGKLLNGGPPDQTRVGDLLGTARNAADGFEQLQGLLRPYLSELDALYQQRKITGTCHDYLRAETEQRLLYWAGGLLGSYLRDSVASRLHLRLNPAQAQLLTRQLFARYDPSQPRYRFSSLGNDQEQAALRARGVLAGAPPASGTWAGFHAAFLGVDSNIDAFDYAAPAVQEAGVGSAILNALGLKAMPEADLRAVVAAYTRQFPGSAYTPVLAAGLAAGLAPPAGASPAFGYYRAGSGQLADAARPGFDTVRTLSGLVRSQRPGRAVFVDIWATWCGPCLGEFSHEPELHQFLASHDVDILYLSIDQPGLREKWATLIAQYRLQGYHCLASAALQKALSPGVPYIPRYLLFDKTGRLVEASTYHPSEGEKLYRQVRERLQLP